MAGAQRAADLVRQLQLRPHPEGGYYAEVYRSSSMVQPADDRPSRAALTTIYFLLMAGDISRWHRVRSDEVWHFYEGAPLELLVMAGDVSTLASRRLGPVAGDSPHPASRPVETVAAGEWQAARTSGDYTLVGCTVAPGFDFDDFVLAHDLPDVAAAIRVRHPQGALFI